MPLKKPKSLQDKDPNFRDNRGNLYLVRCYSELCGDRENYAFCVATGRCAWCGWKEGVDD